MIRSSNDVVEPLESRTLLAGFPLTFGSNDFDAAYKVAAAPDGGVVVAGLFSGTADFDPSSGKALLTAVGKHPDEPQHNVNAFVARYSRTGGLVWVKQFAGDQGELDSDEAIDFPIDPSRAGPFDNGVALMPRLLGEYVNAMQVDAQGNVFLAFSFRSNVDFDPGPGRTILSSVKGKSYVDIALVKLNSSGNLAFARQIGGRFTDVAQGMALDALGNVFLTGYFTRECDFDPTSGVKRLTSYGREDVFVAKYNASGLLTWVKSTVGEEATRVDRSAGNAITVDGAGNAYVTGSFAGRTDFNPNGSSLKIDPIDKTDTFVARYTSAGALSWVKTIGGEGYDAGLAMAYSSTDNTIVFGSYFEDVIDVDPGSATRPVQAAVREPGDDDPSAHDLLIEKLNTTTGALVWFKKFGNGGFETFGDLTVAANGNVITTGGFYGSLDFDPGRSRFVLRSTVGVDQFDDQNDRDRFDSYDVFVQTLAADGDFVAATRFGAAGDDYGTAVSVLPSGEAYVAGMFRGTYVFPNTSNKKLRPIGKQDGFVGLFDEDLAVI